MKNTWIAIAFVVTVSRSAAAQQPLRIDADGRPRPKAGPCTPNCASSFASNRIILGTVAFSSDDKWIIGSPSHGGPDKIRRIIVWDAASGNEVLNFKTLPWVVHGLDISPDGQRNVCGGHSHGNGRRNVTVWALKKAER